MTRTRMVSMKMPRPADVAFALLAALAAVMAVVLVLVLSGVVTLDDPQPAAQQDGVPAPAPVSAPATQPRPADTRKPPEDTVPHAGPAVEPPQDLRVVVTATRGDCWVSARIPDGRVLIARVLARGETVTLRGRQVELSLGAASNVDVRVNGRPREVPAGTVTVLLGRRASKTPA
jgi:cytoskeleton protein RodZ